LDLVFYFYSIFLISWDCGGRAVVKIHFR